MDINDLFLSCRKGDLNRVRYLVENKEVQLNVRDKWDSTPLYYACLCGYMDIAKYLLENGARCEANTFDGERCLYGALSTEIRNLLRDFKVVTSKSLQRDCYDEFLRRCFENGEYQDVVFSVHGEMIPAHKCVLAARSEYFRDMFLDRWKNRKIITINNKIVTVSCLKAVLGYLYTGRLETHVEMIEDIFRLAKQCRLESLIQQLEDSQKKVFSFQCTKPGTKVTTILVEPGPDSYELTQDFATLAKQGMPLELCTWVTGSELPFLPNLEHSSYPDLCFNVQGYHFLCHKVFFCGRSDYFKVLIKDHFSEAEVSCDKQIPIISLHNVSYEVFVCIHTYMYQNTTELSLSNVYDVLCVADLYLLPGLKRDCGIFIGQYTDIHNVCSVLKTARMFSLPRLEDQCIEFMAKNLEHILKDPDFHDIVREDASDVQLRQETDSISVIDDIRYHISCNVQTFSAMEEANEKLNMIDGLLESLGLDA